MATKKKAVKSKWIVKEVDFGKIKEMMEEAKSVSYAQQSWDFYWKSVQQSTEEQKEPVESKEEVEDEDIIDWVAEEYAHYVVSTENADKFIQKVQSLAYYGRLNPLVIINLFKETIWYEPEHSL